MLEGVGRVDDHVLAGLETQLKEGVAQAIAALDELAHDHTRSPSISAGLAG
jgi:hypothetical protein